MHQNISFPVQKFSGHSHGISTVENPIPTLGTLCCLNPRAFDTRHQILHWPSNVSILVLYDWNPAQHCHQILHWPSNVSILVLHDWNPAHHCHQILHWPSNFSILVLHDWNPAHHCHQILHWPSNVSILVLYDWNMLISERRQIFKRFDVQTELVLDF